MRLDEFTRGMLEEAVRLYLELAYEGGRPPEAVARRLEWDPGATVAAFAGGDAFEQVPPDVPPPEAAHIRLRLGNRAYPHMKLALERVADTDEWVLMVDCHDRRLMEVASAADRDRIEALVDLNARAKAAIEDAWTEAGLPTFQRFVRDRLGS